MPGPDPRTWLGRATALSATPVAAVSFVLALLGGSAAATAAFAPHPPAAATSSVAAGHRPVPSPDAALALDDLAICGPVDVAVSVVRPAREVGR